MHLPRLPRACHGVNIVTARMMGARSPLATASRPAQSFVFVGILGGFTTFSSFMLDSLTLWQLEGAHRAAVNLIGQLAVVLVFTHV
jgi:CrcB protein